MSWLNTSDKDWNTSYTNFKFLGTPIFHVFSSFHNIRVVNFKTEDLKPHCIQCSHFKVDDVSVLEASSKPPVLIVEDNVTASLHQQHTAWPWLRPGCTRLDWIQCGFKIHTSCTYSWWYRPCHYTFWEYWTILILLPINKCFFRQSHSSCSLPLHRSVSIRVVKLPTQIAKHLQDCFIAKAGLNFGK
jgi:hypothetical protein